MLERLISAVLAPACTAALLACVPGPDDAVATPGRAPAAGAVPVADSRAIVGQWDIVSFRGYEPRRRLQGAGRAAYADFAVERVALHLECNYSGAAGRVKAGRFVAASSDHLQTLIGCGPEREARDAALFRFFDRNPSVEHLRDGRLRLTAGSDVLLLERPAARRLAYLPSPQQLLGEWRLLEITRYVEGGGIASIGLGDVPGRIEFDGIEARFSGCPAHSLRYRYTPEGRIEKLGGVPVPTGRHGCGALANEAVGRDMPGPHDVLRVLHGDPLVELVDDDTILLSTERYGVLLTKRAP